MKIRDRIRELRRVPAGELVPNPQNWRTHPEDQQNAMRGILAEVGYVDALLARELPDGSLMLIDGHLRAETTPDMEVPVLIVDLDEAEAAKVLATFDPLSAMAETNAEALDELLREIDTGSEALQEMLADLAAKSGLYDEWTNIDTGEGKTLDAARDKIVIEVEKEHGELARAAIREALDGRGIEYVQR